MSNPHPTCKFDRHSELKLASRMTGVRLTVDQDQYVRSLPNKTEWLRKAIAAQIERDMQQGKSA